MNEEQRKSMELAKQVVTSFLERNNAAEMREILKDPENWEELQRSHGDNYYEKLVLRSIRGLKQAAILEVLNTIYKKVQHQQDKNEFAKNIFLFYEQNPNGYKLSDTHRQVISEWAETESEQPQQKEKQRKIKQRKVKCFDDFISNDVKDKDSFKKRLHVSLDGKHGKQPMRDYFLPELSNGRILEGMSYEVFNKEFPNVINKADYYLIKQEKKPVPRHDKFT